jgi:cytochrome c
VAEKSSPLAPNLSGVVGRKAASLAFNYSAALKRSGLTWDRNTLDRYLAAPSRLVPGTRMTVTLSDTQQRSALIAYLSKAK